MQKTNNETVSVVLCPRPQLPRFPRSSKASDCLQEVEKLINIYGNELTLKLYGHRWIRRDRLDREKINTKTRRIHIYIYIYIYREREREIERNKKREKESQEGERESEQARTANSSAPQPGLHVSSCHFERPCGCGCF